MTGKLNVRRAKFFKLTTTTTRGHHLKIRKEQSTHQARQRFFSQRVANCWNGLPSEIVSANTTVAFKERLDKCLQLQPCWALLSIPSYLTMIQPRYGHQIAFCYPKSIISIPIPIHMPAFLHFTVQCYIIHVWETNVHTYAGVTDNARHLFHCT